jgi:hypothetical protein
MSVLIPSPGELADLAHLAVELREDGDASTLADELLGEIERRIIEHPRSQQVAIGPSEIGTACARQLMYQMAGVAPARDRGAPWLPTIGTACHDWLAETLIEANQRLGWDRYLIELRSNAGHINGYGDLTGSADVYDRLTGTVIDWKIVGATSLKKYRGRMRDEYRVQPHTYGLGISRRGLPVRRVLVMCLPRNQDSVRGGTVWSEPFDEQIALAAIARAERVNTLRAVLGIARAATVTNGELLAAGVDQLADPTGLGDALAVPLADACRYCPWLAAGSNDLTRACPGVSPGVAPEREVTAADVLRGPGRRK